MDEMKNCGMTNACVITPEMIGRLASVIETGQSAFFESVTLGEDFEVELGYFFGEKLKPNGKSANGSGLKHIIQSRLENDKQSIETITTLLILVLETAFSGADVSTKTDVASDYRKLEKNGIIALFSKKRGVKPSSPWLLTGFIDRNNETVATDTIRTGNALYGYTPEYSLLRKQVGAVTASLSIYHNSEKVSSPLPKKKRNRGWEK